MANKTESEEKKTTGTPETGEKKETGTPEAAKTENNGGSSEKKEEKKGMSTGKKVGIAAGAVALLGLAAWRVKSWLGKSDEEDNRDD